ncbi:hypothetical protein ACVZHM_23555, partial [Vibrio alginolyticus]
ANSYIRKRSQAATCLSVSDKSMTVGVLGFDGRGGGLPSCSDFSKKWARQSAINSLSAFR